MPNPTRQDGIVYPSQRAFARAVGVKRQTVEVALSRGTIENCGKGRKRPVNYLGVDYPGIVDAVAATGSTRAKVTRWANNAAKRLAKARKAK